MTKAGLTAKVAKEAKITKVSAAQTIDCVSKTITQELREGGRISLTDFGRFWLETRRPELAETPRKAKR